VKTPWGEINRFQRLSGAIDAGFDDTKPSRPVAFASGEWGSLAAFAVTARRKKRNAFTAIAATASSPSWNSARA